MQVKRETERGHGLLLLLGLRVGIKGFEDSLLLANYFLKDGNLREEEKQTAQRSTKIETNKDL